MTVIIVTKTFSLHKDHYLNSNFECIWANISVTKSNLLTNKGDNYQYEKWRHLPFKNGDFGLYKKGDV